MDIFKQFRELFVKRMSEDSATADRRRKDYNQAIFFWSSEYEEYRQVFQDTTMEMVLECFDKAVKDYQKQRRTDKWQNVKQLNL